MADVVLFQPDIPQNTAAILRSCACLGTTAHIIHPAGFALSDRTLRRAGMDYLDRASLHEHRDWTAFLEARGGRRLVAFSTKGSVPLDRFTFRADDLLVFGRESAGLPPAALDEADAILRIPIRTETRSLNLAAAVAIGLYEALRQTGGLAPVNQPSEGGAW